MIWAHYKHICLWCSLWNKCYTFSSILNIHVNMKAASNKCLSISWRFGLCVWDVGTYSWDMVVLFLLRLFRCGVIPHWWTKRSMIRIHISHRPVLSLSLYGEVWKTLQHKLIEFVVCTAWKNYCPVPIKCIFNLPQPLRTSHAFCISWKAHLCTLNLAAHKGKPPIRKRPIWNVACSKVSSLHVRTLCNTTILEIGPYLTIFIYKSIPHTCIFLIQVTWRLV